MQETDRVIYLTPEEWQGFAKRGQWIHVTKPGSSLTIFHGHPKARPEGAVGEIGGKKIFIKEEK